MTHELQDRFSGLVLEKLRKELILKDGIVFNNDYEGDPKSGVVKIPVRDAEVLARDYDKSVGLSANSSSTSYISVTVNNDKGVNEIIDGYDAAAVPDGIVAERLNSAAFALQNSLDNDGASELIVNGKKVYLSAMTPQTVYETVVDTRKMLSKANVPNDGKRYLLVTPDCYALMLKDTTNFIRQSDLSQKIVESGAIGKYAGFVLYEWNESTVGLMYIAGHPKYAARIKEWQVPVYLSDLKDSDKFIGACAVKGRMVYAHKVLQSDAIIPVFSPEQLTLSPASDGAGKTVVTVSGFSGTLKYRLAPSERAVFGMSTASGFTALTSGTTAITASSGTIIEVVEVDSGSKVVKSGYTAAL